MAIEQIKEPSREMDWKNMGESVSTEAGNVHNVKKRLPKRMRQIPNFYFFPRRSVPYNIAFFGACIGGGVGAGMLLEIWINKKIKEDGGVIWEFGK